MQSRNFAKKKNSKLKCAYTYALKLQPIPIVARFFFSAKVIQIRFFFQLEVHFFGTAIIK